MEAVLEKRQPYRTRPAAGEEADADSIADSLIYS